MTTKYIDTKLDIELEIQTFRCNRCGDDIDYEVIADNSGSLHFDVDLTSHTCDDY